MQIINVREAIRYPLTVFKSEFRPIIGICWIYILLSCALQLSINYVYHYLRQNALLDKYLDDYWAYSFVFCPVAQALLGAASVVAVYRHLISGPQQKFINIVLRRDLLSDAPTLSLPIYFPASRAVILFTLFIAFWEYSLNQLRLALPFKVFPGYADTIPRIIFANVCIIGYSFILAQLVLVFPYVATSKTLGLRRIKEQVVRLKGNRWRAWTILMYFSLFYFSIYAVLGGEIGRRIPFDFYHSELFVNLRYGVRVVAWFAYIVSMIIFSAKAFKDISKLGATDTT